jgi:hypothetical protein
MIHGSKSEAPVRRLEAFLGERVREMQANVRGLLDVAAGRRSTAWRFEDLVRDWEIRIRVHPPRGSRWNTLLQELRSTISLANDLYRRILKAENRILPLLEAWIQRARTHAGENDRMIPPKVLDRLESSAELRACSLVAIEQALEVSSRIRAITARTTTLDVLALIEARRRRLADSESLWNQAETIERRAFSLDTKLVSDLESAATKALGADDDDVETALSPPIRSGRDPFLDLEWEDWLHTAKDGKTERSTGAGSKSASSNRLLNPLAPVTLIRVRRPNEP